jgi:photosystem II stability/assembly factor-like uncharacterized protein
MPGYAMGLAFAAAPARTIYAAGIENVYRSKDAGATWSPLINPQLESAGAYSIAADPGNAATVYLGTPYLGVLKSIDGGATWTHTAPFACGAVWSLVLDPRHPGTIYAGCTEDDISPVFKSTDGGATWTPKGSGLPLGRTSLLTVRVALVPDKPDTLFVSLGDGSETETFRSRDGGGHWSPAGPGGLPLAAGPSGVVFAGTHRSTDGGETWTEMGALPAEAVSYAVDPLMPQTVYASAGFLGVFKSVDGGTTWAPANQGFRATFIEAVAVDPQQTSTLYVYARGVGLRKSLSGGSRWRRADAGLPAGIDELDPPVLAIDPVTPARLWVGWRRGLARSTDGGVSWTVLDPLGGQCLDVKDLAVDPRSPSTLYGAGLLAAGGCEGGTGCSVFRSLDAGETWQCAAPPTTSVEHVVIDPAEPARVYAVSLSKQGVWRSEDRGAHWRLAGRGLRYANAPVTLAIDPTDPRRLYLGTLSKLMKSTDRGESWTESDHGLPAGVVHTIVVNPVNPQIVYAGENSGVFISGNGGRTWFSMNGGLPSFTWPLALDPKIPDKLYAGTASSLYTYERRK